MIRGFCAMCFLATVTWCMNASGADWPRFGGPNGDGSAPDIGINKDWAAKPPRTLWTATLSDNGHAGISVANGKVFIVDHRGQEDVVRALDLQTGKDLWAYAYADATNGVYGFTMSTPLVEQGRVYTYSRMGKALCLDVSNGQLVWSRDTRADFKVKRNEFDHATSPAMVDGKVIVLPGASNAAVVALDAQTGKIAWHGGGDSIAGYASPVVAAINGQTQLVVFVAEGVIGLDPADGKRLWNFPWPTPKGQNSATPIVRGNTVLITSAWGLGTALLDVTGNQPRVIWESKEMQSRFPSPVILQDRIYGTRDPNKLVCLEAQTGKLLWSKSGVDYASLLAVDGAIIVQEGKSGDLVLLDGGTPEYKELGRMRPLSGPECWSAPVIVDGKLLVRNRNAMVCIEMK